MKKSQFAKLLKEKGTAFVDSGSKITVLGGSVDLRSLTSLPDGVKFENQGYVDLRSLTSLPDGVKFENQGSVDLESLTSLPDGVKFENQGSVYLRSLTSLPDGVKFENQGSVDLESLTSLPDGVKFENQGYVYLRSLTSLPDGVKFENQGYVDLKSLTSLPDGVKFENQGYVDLKSLTSLPDGVKFENQGYVDLESLTSLPDGVKFENQGYVYLRSLTSPVQTYLGKEREFRHIDDYTMLIISKKEQDDFTIYNAKFFGGGDIKKLRTRYIAETQGVFAHGETLKSAIEDVQYKLSERAGKQDAINRVKSSKQVTVNDFRIITGACRDGIREHLSHRNIDMDETESLPLEDALKAMAGSSFGEHFEQELELETS